MADIARWISGPNHDPLGVERERIVRTWALKTHILLCFIEGNAGRFDDESFQGECVVPPVTLAKAVFNGEIDEVASSCVGVSRSGSKADFAWSFGYPKVTVSEGAEGAARFAPVSILTVGGLQLWVVAPVIQAHVKMPKGIQVCRTGLCPKDLAPTSHPKLTDVVCVDLC